MTELFHGGWIALKCFIGVQFRSDAGEDAGACRATPADQVPAEEMPAAGISLRTCRQKPFLVYNRKSPFGSNASTWVGQARSVLPMFVRETEDRQTEQRDFTPGVFTVCRKAWAKKTGAAGAYMQDEEGTGDQARASQEATRGLIQD